MSTLIADVKLRARLETKLNDLADEFVQVAKNAQTLAGFDKWDGQAENLRQLAKLVNKDMTTESVAQSFIRAAEKLLAAEEAAIHESRAARREGANQ